MLETCSFMYISGPSHIIVMSINYSVAFYLHHPGEKKHGSISILPFIIMSTFWCWEEDISGAHAKWCEWEIKIDATVLAFKWNWVNFGPRRVASCKMMEDKTKLRICACLCLFCSKKDVIQVWKIIKSLFYKPFWRNN